MDEVGGYLTAVIVVCLEVFEGIVEDEIDVIIDIIDFNIHSGGGRGVGVDGDVGSDVIEGEGG